MQVAIYRASKRDEMYLYVPVPTDGSDALAKLPASLLQVLGRLTAVMTLDLTPTRQLARVDVKDVLTHLETTGYFVQLPPNGLIDPDAPPPPGLQGA